MHEHLLTCECLKCFQVNKRYRKMDLDVQYRVQKTYIAIAQTEDGLR